MSHTPGGYAYRRILLTQKELIDGQSARRRDPAPSALGAAPQLRRLC